LAKNVQAVVKPATIFNAAWPVISQDKYDIPIITPACPSPSSEVKDEY